MLRIYLDVPAILAAGGTIETKQIGKGSDAYDRKTLCFNTNRIDIDANGDVYLSASDLSFEMSPDLQKFVTGVSFYDNFGYGYTPRRQVGEYRLGSAVADLTETGGSVGHYHLKLRAKSMGEMRELYHLIREGKIWPARDYEVEQVPPPYRHLRETLIEAWRLVRRDISDRLYRIKRRVAL